MQPLVPLVLSICHPCVGSVCSRARHTIFHKIFSVVLVSMASGVWETLHVSGLILSFVLFPFTEISRTALFICLPDGFVNVSTRSCVYSTLKREERVC